MKSSEMNDEQRLAYEIAIDGIYESADVWGDLGEEYWFEEVDPESPVAGDEEEGPGDP